MDAANDPVAKVIEDNTKEKLPDLNVNQINILAERLRNDEEEAKEAVDQLKIVFKSEKVKRQYWALLMLEILSKHGSVHLHQYLSEEDFMLEFMKCFKMCTGKTGFFMKFESKVKRELRERVEHHGLYLLQLWADTFMMYQDKYPGFQKCYRELKVKGVKFPARDNNERTMMDNLVGISSPMFDFIEQSAKPKDSPKSPEANTSQEEQKDDSHEDKSKEEEHKSEEQEVKEAPKLESTTQVKQDTASKVKEDYLELDQSVVDEIEGADYSKYAKEIFDKTEFDIAKQNADILDNMLLNCDNYEDICRDVVIELYETAMKSKIRVEKILSVRKSHDVKDDKESELLEAVRYVNSKIEDFKQKHWKYKKKHERKIRKQKRAEKKKMKEYVGPDIHHHYQGKNFDVLDTTESQFEEKRNQVQSSDEESSGGEGDSSDSDGLHKGVDLKELQKRKSKGRKSKNSQASDKKPEEKKGFFRNSVLVQRTLNFFGRKSKLEPYKAQSNKEEEELDTSADKDNDRAKLTHTKSDAKPELSDYFVQTQKNKENPNKNSDDEMDNIFETAQEEVDVDYFTQTKPPRPPVEEADDEAEEEKAPLDRPVFTYKENIKANIPLPKSKSKKMKDPVDIKRLSKPPKPKENFRNSEIRRFELADLVDNH